MSAVRLSNVKATKECSPGDRVSFRAKALRFWEVGGLRMALVGDASGLTRVEVGDAALGEGRSYEFRNAGVVQYPGGWTSVSIANGGEAIELAEEIEVPQDEAYIERTFKILAGVQRKKGRVEGRLPAWEHPAGESKKA
jgi:hypothetical protein